MQCRSSWISHHFYFMLLKKFSLFDRVSVTIDCISQLLNFKNFVKTGFKSEVIFDWEGTSLGVTQSFAGRQFQFLYVDRYISPGVTCIIVNLPVIRLKSAGLRDFWSTLCSQNQATEHQNKIPSFKSGLHNNKNVFNGSYISHCCDTMQVVM